MGFSWRPPFRLVYAVFLLSSLIGQLSQFAVGITDPSETEALLVIKEGLEDPDGRLASWVATTDPCDAPWDGVLCEDGDLPPTLAGTNTSHVTELRLLNRNLSGQLADEFGKLPGLVFLDFMGNHLNGSIPASIGSLGNLKLLLLNTNQLTGVLPPELGNLGNMIRIQVDSNNISGQIPSTFANLTRIQHFHMNNNSLNGSIPEGLGSLPDLVHVLLDNNELTGTLPEDLANAPSLKIIQLDNNRFPALPLAYTTIPTLLKLSLRNCGLQGSMPNFNRSSSLAVLDLSNNNLTGSLPTSSQPVNMTVIDLAHNQLQGSVPESFGDLDELEYLELRNNNLSGTIPSNLGTGGAFLGNANDSPGKIILDFQDTSLQLPTNSNLANLSSQGVVEVWLSGSSAACPEGGASASNPLCVPHTISDSLEVGVVQVPTPDFSGCPQCKPPNQLAPAADRSDCRCAVPMTIVYRLKSPGFTVFDLYEEGFISYIADALHVSQDDVKVDNYVTQPGPRIQMTLLIFPSGSTFNETEVSRIRQDFLQWRLADSSTFGPYEIISVQDPEKPSPGKSSSGLSAGAIAGVAVGASILAAILAGAFVFMFCMPKRRKRSGEAKWRPLNVKGVRAFTFKELVKATDNFSDRNELGKGGYGRVYLGTLEDGHRVAVKRADEGSKQGTVEFETEIQLLSRLHHRHLLSLLGYCNEPGKHIGGEQMLVYEFIANGNLRDHLDSSAKAPLDLITRLRIALGAARGLQYLHTQVDPPIFHRDIKASNILLDGKYDAKVSDFGLSKLAPSEADFEGVNLGYVSTMVKGTPGYLDPEYFLTHRLTDKSDVYSFGIVLLELATGRPAISNGKNLKRDVYAAFEGKIDVMEIADPRMDSYPVQDPASVLQHLTELAFACCQDVPESRPSIKEVVLDLEDMWKQASASSSDF